MKLSALIFPAIFICSIAAGQNKCTAFSSEKRSIDLSTGICMRYIETGNANGVPVLFLHGYTDTARSFQLVIEQLKEINGDVRIIAPDLRGHGDTSMPDAAKCKNAPENCFAPSQLAEDVLNLMDQLCIQKFHVVGHSMGSVVGQTLAINQPHRISSMILIGTFVNGKGCSTIHDFLLGELIEKDWKCMLEEKLAVNWPADVYHMKPANMGEKIITYLREHWVVEPGASKDFIDSIFPETIKMPFGAWIGAIKALGEIDYSAALKKLNIPTLILWGSEDNATDTKDQAKVKSSFKAAAHSTGVKVLYKTYEKFPAGDPDRTGNGLGHNFHWAVPRMVAEDIDLFIRQRGAVASKALSEGVERGTTTQYASSVVELK